MPRSHARTSLFPRARLIARLKRRVRRQGNKSTETVDLISRLTVEQLDAAGWSKLKRGYCVIESRLPHALDVSLEEDRSRVRQPQAALAVGMFRRLVVSVAEAASEQAQTRRRAGACGAISSALPIAMAARNASVLWCSPNPRFPRGYSHEKMRPISGLTRGWRAILCIVL